MFAKRLKDARKEKNLRLKDVALYVNVTERAICNYESGIREPDFATLKKLCDLLDVTADYLIGRTDY